MNAGVAASARLFMSHRHGGTQDAVHRACPVGIVAFAYNASTRVVLPTTVISGTLKLEYQMLKEHVDNSV